MDNERFLKIHSIVDSMTEKLSLGDFIYQIIDTNLFIFMETSCNNNCIFCPKKKFTDKNYLEQITQFSISYEKITDVHLAAEESFNVVDILDIILFFGKKWLKIHIMSSLNGISIDLLKNVINTGYIESVTTSIHWYGPIHDLVTGKIGNFNELFINITLLQVAKISVYSMWLILDQNIEYLSTLSAWLLKNNINHIYMYPRLKSIYFSTKYIAAFSKVKAYLKNCSFPVFWLPLCILDSINRSESYFDISNLRETKKISFLVDRYLSLYVFRYSPNCTSCIKRHECTGIPIFISNILNNSQEIKPFL